jgi:hypothetical protein
MAITQSISALGTPPNTADPVNFPARADALLGTAMPLMVTQMNAFATQANAMATAMNFNSTTDSSVTSNLIGLGAKTFAVSAAKSFQPGMWLVMADALAPSTNSMMGQVTSYVGTSLVVNITAIVGAGTKASWVISQSSGGLFAPAALSTSVAALNTSVAAQCGQVVMFARSTAPAGYLKLNGASVDTVAYANLVAACYVGDAQNATATQFYKCTNPATPTTTRSIAGLYMVLPDWRGEFPRFFDDARGVDAGRVLGSAQAGTVHTTAQRNNGGGAVGAAWSDDISNFSTGGELHATVPTVSNGGTIFPAGSVYQTEGALINKFSSRPRNVALLACIKY